MKIVAKKKLWQFLFWVGPFLFIVGLTAGLVSERWDLIPLAFIISGIVISGLWVVLQSQQNDWWKSRSTQASTNALVATLAMLVILGLINFLGNRYHLRVDLTETQLFSLAPESQQLVRSLPQPVKVWIFDINQNPQDRELLDIYRRQSSKFEFEYVDPQAKPGIAQRFGVRNVGEVYLESQNRKQLVQVINENERLSEIKLTNRLLQITSFSNAKVYFIQGHGEHQLASGKDAISQAVTALGERKYTTESLTLAQKGSVPQDASVVVVAGPKRDLFENEVKALDDYLNQGGNLLLMIDPGTDAKLGNLLAEWGVKLDNRLAVDISGQLVGRGPAEPIVTEYGQHPITKVFGNGISVYRLARPLQITPVAGIEATPLLLTKPYPESWAESDLQSENLQFNADKDLKGPLILGVALTKKLPIKLTSTPQPSPLPSPTTQTKASPKNPVSLLPSPTIQTKVSPKNPVSLLPSPTIQTKASPTVTASPLSSPTDDKSKQTATESRMVVLGNSDFATDGLFQQQLNGDVFLNSVTWLSQQDRQLLSISPKEPRNRRINLTNTQANFLALSSQWILPLIGLVAAAVIWWQRR
ncbi:ABC transporter [Nostoc sp. KVJ3]|uniref:Gldg family protein n=1 Tax=Nostoc sp. KVJ3 TaxID=457945 RepID=UPI0022370258|nr:Gldg family protein [Nostoc sp. KVJ3]MCW5316026.1 ABC transporter [Nostoc sp. KVJ3]